MIVRPTGMIIDGVLELGLEAMIIDGTIVELRPHTGIPEDFVLSPAFVNAHSHLEYRGMQGQLPELDYWPWLRALTEMKSGQSLVQVERDCLLAAQENRQTGVGMIAEHTDRPGSASALAEVGLQAMLFQEVITFFEREDRLSKLKQLRAKMTSSLPCYLNPHALFTVDDQTLTEIGQAGGPVSIHFAESLFERQLVESGAGLLADFYVSNGVALPSHGSLVGWLEAVGLLRPGVQLVHACDVTEVEIETLAENGLTVAHCPRSNAFLGCPDAPVYEMIQAGIAVGLGLDSAASSGPIDYFAEMRAGMAAGLRRGRPLTGEQVWRMATRHGAESIPWPGPSETFGRLGWEIFEGSQVPLIKIHVPHATTTEEVIEHGSPELVSWL